MVECKKCGKEVANVNEEGWCSECVAEESKPEASVESSEEASAEQGEPSEEKEDKAG